jgi:hypothetical protein
MGVCELLPGKMFSKMIDLGEIDDDKLLLASRVAFETGDLTPLIKEELKCVIQSRRLAVGKEELDVSCSPRAQKQVQPIFVTELHHVIGTRLLFACRDIFLFCFRDLWCT